MRAALAAVVGAAAFVVACTPGVQADGAQPAVFTPRYRSAPDEFGVVCYRELGSSTLSCVQVMPPRPAPQRQSVPLT